MNDPVLDQALKDLSKQARVCAVPIAAMQGSTFNQHGTGTLLRIGGTVLLVTAGHVLAQANATSADLYIIPTTESGSELPVKGRAIFTRRKNPDDPLDVGFVVLDSDVVQDLGTREGVRLHDIDQNPNFAAGVLLSSATRP